MGGRGSSGGRGGNASTGITLGSSVSNAAKQNEIDSKGFSKQIQEKLANMTDKELNRTIINSKNLMNNENAKLAFERNKLQKLNDEFKKLKDDDPRIDSKWNEIQKQMDKVSEQQSYANARTQIHYLAINEKYNVRDKHIANNISSMTNGQLNSFYNKSYKEGAKARTRLEKTNNSKTRAKYQKLYDEHNNNFNKATAERDRRSLWGSDW